MENMFVYSLNKRTKPIIKSYIKYKISSHSASLFIMLVLNIVYNVE